jgi:hypothetical protein
VPPLSLDPLLVAPGVASLPSLAVRPPQPAATAWPATAARGPACATARHHGSRRRVHIGAAACTAACLAAAARAGASRPCRLATAAVARGTACLASAQRVAARPRGTPAAGAVACRSLHRIVNVSASLIGTPACEESRSPTRMAAKPVTHTCARMRATRISLLLGRTSRSRSNSLLATCVRVHGFTCVRPANSLHANGCPETVAVAWNSLVTAPVDLQQAYCFAA